MPNQFESIVNQFKKQKEDLPKACDLLKGGANSADLIKVQQAIANSFTTSKKIDQVLKPGF